ncbi:MAG TPA: LPS export ABC transporter ATP-binding protein [Longimicrobiales bacterium]|nr:LPS export ABC transporter ATP-binding protein [Longimicrobiales bacterium]
MITGPSRPAQLDALRERLRGQDDASLTIAVAELLRVADDEGMVDRGKWLASVRAASQKAGPGGASGGAVWQVGPDQEAGEFSRYLREHVLNRLSEWGLARPEPDDEAWERVRFTEEAWAELEPRRAAVQAEFDAFVRRLAYAARTTGRASVSVPDAPGDSTLRAIDLTKSYRKRKVVHDVSLKVSQGEIVGLLGPNGAGKTTVFYMMVGLIRPDAGKVFLDDTQLTRMAMFRRARLGIGYLAQEPSVFRRLTVEENIRAILETQDSFRARLAAPGRVRAASEERLESLLDELSIKHLRKAKAYSLSGGERRRLEITRALVSRPKFMLLDEPFAGVDPIAVHDIQQIVADLRHRNIGVVITDHNVEQTLDIVDRAYIMYDGRVRESGTVAELVWNDEVAEIYFGPTLTARMRERYRQPRRRAAASAVAGPTRDSTFGAGAPETGRA